MKFKYVWYNVTKDEFVFANNKASADTQYISNENVYVYIGVL